MKYVRGNCTPGIDTDLCALPYQLVTLQDLLETEGMAGKL